MAAASRGALVPVKTATDFGPKCLDTHESETLSVALIGPNEKRRSDVRKALAKTRRGDIREFDSYPPEFDHLKKLLVSIDVIILDLDSDPDVALRLVEEASTSSSAKLMLYSENSDPKLAIRAMRAGACEHLLLPVEPEIVDEALARAASSLRTKANPSEKALGKVLVFAGSKGGSGVTTVACNVAIALAHNSDQRVLLIDLALPIGDAALCLGIAADYSTEDALQESDRLDAHFLETLVVKHRTGVFVLAAPTKVPEVEATKEAIDKLVAIARTAFDHVIVDVGSRIDVPAKALFDDASTIYLVTQTGISELRNSNRLISQLFSDGSPNLEIVINKFQSRFNNAVNEDVIAKALGRPVRWKIPDDQNAARALQSGNPRLGESQISRISQEMAGSITGRPIPKGKKKESGSNRSELKTAQADSGKAGRSGIPTMAAMTSAITWPTPNAIPYGEGLSPAQLNATASIAGTFVYTPGPGYILPVGTHTLWVTVTPAGSSGPPAQAAVSILVYKATPSICWPEPAEIPGGTPLDETQLNASTPVEGVFEYSPAAGTVLPRGTHTLSVTFNPADSENYSPVEASVSLTVAKETPVIEWPAPEAISYGALLGETQLRASASVPGSFEYTPGPGALLAAGEHRLSAVFTPEDAQEYNTAETGVVLTVGRAAPSIEWPIPDPIAAGNALSAVQLNATSAVPGSLAYKPAAGEILAPGVHRLSVTFTPTDKLNYTTAEAAVSLTVKEKLPSDITWLAPSAIRYGAALSADQLNATASVPGRLVYTPSAGHVLPPGRYTLAVSFTPTDTEKFTTAQATVELEVEGAPAPAPAPNAAAETPSDWSVLDSNSAAADSAPAPADAATPREESTEIVSEATAATEAPYEWSFLTGNAALADSDPARVKAAGESKSSSDIDPEGAAAADTASEWGFLMNKSAPADSAPRQEKVKAQAERSSNGSSSPKSAAEQPSPWTPVAGHAAPANSAKPEATSEPAQTEVRPSEKRTYKGAVYQKGEDGQWHLQKE